MPKDGETDFSQWFDAQDPGAQSEDDYHGGQYESYGPEPGGGGFRPGVDEDPASAAEEEHDDGTYQIVGKQNTNPRGWFYGWHLLRGRVSADYAPGGVGKTALKISEALAMATGKPLMGLWVLKPMRVLYWNLEDSLDELKLRIEAAADHFGITNEHIGDRLKIWDCERKIKLVTVIGGEVCDMTSEIERLRRFIANNKIDVMILDPLIELHDTDENGNVAMKRVLGHLRQIAVETRCAVSVVHHTRKMNGGEVTADDGRGASSITGLCRDVRVLNCMSREEAEAVGISADHRRRYISYVSDKTNAALPPEKKNWFQMLSVDMENAKGEDASESVGVAVPFNYEEAKPKVSGRDVLRCQQALQDAYDAGNPGRQSYKAGDWAGHIIAKELGLNVDVGSPERPIVTKLLKDWLRNGALIVDDDWTDKDHKKRPVIVVGQWAVVE